MSSIRYHFAVIAAKCTGKLIRLTGRDGSHTPGVVAQKICPDFLSQAPKAPLAICVTGTNGKTTVSNLLTDALRSSGKKVVNNRTGSNIVPGCTTNLLNSLNWLGKCNVDATVFEVDERASRLILPYIKPDYLVVTNLFRDSLKRNAHPDYIFSVIDTYCPSTTKLILNADELCSSMLRPHNQRVFYGIGKMDGDITEPVNIVADYTLCPNCGTKLQYEYLRYHHIGHGVCPQCDFHAQDPDYLASNVNLNEQTMTVSYKGTETVFPLISKITFNIYNELTVIATLLELGLSAEQVCDMVRNIQVPDSRLNETCVGGISVVQAMSKGQSSISSCRTFDYVSAQPGNKAIVLAMDDAYDRKKSIEYIGWIYDVDYEFLTRAGVQQVVATGPRCYDHKVRLLLAGIPEEKIFCATDELAGIDLIRTEDVDAVYILYDTSTYGLSCQMKEKLLKKLEAAQ